MHNMCVCVCVCVCFVNMLACIIDYFLFITQKKSVTCCARCDIVPWSTPSNYASCIITLTQRNTRARTQRNFLTAFWHARGIVFQESVSVTYRLLNLNCSHTYRTSGFFSGVTKCASVPGDTVSMWHTYILISYARCFRQKKCKILPEGLFLTSTLKPKSEFCKR